MKAIILSADQGSRHGPGTTIWYLQAIDQVAQQAAVWTLDIHGEEWGEVDFPLDVECARALTAKWDAETKTVAA